MWFKSIKESAARNAEVRARLKAEAAQILNLCEDDAITITEISCGASDCPDSETVMIIMRARQPAQAFKFRGPAIHIDSMMLQLTLAPLYKTG
jgi:hypothetical protein